MCLSRTLAEIYSQVAGLPSSRPSSPANFFQGIHDHSYLTHLSSYTPGDCTSSGPLNPKIPNFPRHHLNLHPELPAQVIGLANPSSPSSAFFDALTLRHQSQAKLTTAVFWGKELRIQAEGTECAKAWSYERAGRISCKLAQYAARENTRSLRSIKQEYQMPY